MDALRNIIRREIALAMQGYARTRTGIVDSFDPDTHSAKVRFQPEDSLSGWIPVGSVRVGSGAGMHFAPNVGDQVMVHFLEGDHEAGVIGLRLYSDQDRPLPVPAGETWFVDEKGSGFKFHADGSGEIVTEANLTATVGGALNATVTGAATLTLEGGLTANVTGSAQVTTSQNLTATVSGNLSATISGALNANVSGNATLAAQAVTVNSSNIQLGGAGGKKVVLDGDSVVSGKVVASSGKVTAS